VKLYSPATAGEPAAAGRRAHARDEVLAAKDAQLLLTRRGEALRDPFAEGAP